MYKKTFCKRPAIVSWLFAAIFLAPFVAFADVQLPVQRVIQEETNWCWAAVSSAILNRYGIWPGDGQCTIANFAKGQSNCCNDPAPCNDGHSDSGIEDIFDHWGLNVSLLSLFDHVLFVTSDTQIADELSAGRPFVIGWDWDEGEGHVIIGVGEISSAGYVAYMDPWLGESGGFYWGLRTWVIDGDNHYWASTIVVNDNPPANVTLRHSIHDDTWDFEIAGDITVEDFEFQSQTLTNMEATEIHLQTGTEVRPGASLNIQVI